ncbi:hypothetical protein HYN48_01475 [Flavobacterium magnum]|uniref:Carboxypeptidase regulatory-like domain-containing protein n=1 Tax=Flavobacterium magnum TaxID=2162713 RepID=A0A2S0RB16_9FLAO|nr:hypothetical protein [Flavobacterium magnum]AWA28863.1 hypothetical protein HYN48_01475 [Flavobacterium magnum]
MTKNKLLLYGCLLLLQLAFSQQRVLEGRIFVADGVPSGVHIVNVANEQEVVSDSDGHFSIAADIDDVLVLSAEQLEFQRTIVDKDQYYKGRIDITMISKVTQLEEVEVVNHNNINAVSLRILNRPAKTYTPAERRLRTAGVFKPIQLLGIIAGGMELDPIINAINGKAKRLKKEVLLEKKEMLLSKVNARYTDDYFKTELKIASEYVTGFKYYLVEDADFAETFENGNPERIGIEMARKATDFNAAVSKEKK